MIALPDLSTVPDLAADQDQRVVVLVLRKAADGPVDSDGGAGFAVALGAMVAAAGFDLDASYAATEATDNLPGGVATVAALVDASGE